MEVTYHIPGIDVSGYFLCNKFPAGEDFVKLKTEHLANSHYFLNRDVFFVEKGGNLTDILMSIGQKVDILRRNNCGRISVVIPYLPYARQDRYTTECDSFALKVFATYLNCLNLHKVYAVDVHSAVAGVMDNFVSLPISSVIYQILKKENKPVNILSPDAGAAKKVYTTIGTMSGVNKIFTAEKIRNVTTGSITGIKINGEINNDLTVLIVDDICDGGRTFTGLSDLIKGEKILYVTHGIFSKDDVFSKFSKVYTTDTCKHNLKSYVIKLKFMQKYKEIKQ